MVRILAFHAGYQGSSPCIGMYDSFCLRERERAGNACLSIAFLNFFLIFLGGRIVAEYYALTKRVTQLYTMREMVFPNDEMEIFNEPLEMRLEAPNQQLKKWILRWRPVIDHSMKKVKEMAQTRSIPIWRYYTADQPAKTKVTRHVPTR